MKESAISFKGTQDGLDVQIREWATYASIKSDILEKLSQNSNFFQGGEGICVRFVMERSLMEWQRAELRELLKELLSTDRVEFVSEKSTSAYEMLPKPLMEEDVQLISGAKESSCIFVKSTLRSGQSVHHAGNVIVLGDVNPGAQIIAGGNIVVIGALRGTAHAGADGDCDAIVFAISLEPMQLRIADLIAIAPKRFKRTGYPELASAKNGAIVIEPHTQHNKW